MAHEYTSLTRCRGIRRRRRLPGVQVSLSGSWCVPRFPRLAALTFSAQGEGRCEQDARFPARREAVPRHTRRAIAAARGRRLRTPTRTRTRSACSRSRTRARPARRATSGSRRTPGVRRTARPGADHAEIGVIPDIDGPGDATTSRGVWGRWRSTRSRRSSTSTISPTWRRTISRTATRRRQRPRPSRPKPLPLAKQGQCLNATANWRFSRCSRSPVEPAKGNLLRMRTYDVMITYDKYYQTPRVWLIGYDEVCLSLSPAIFALNARRIAERHAAHPNSNLPRYLGGPCT